MSAPTRGHLRLVHSSDADVIPLPRTAAAYDQVVHIVLRLIPQQAITHRGHHITANGEAVPLWFSAGLSKAVRNGLAEWHAACGVDGIAALTETGTAALREWDRTHGQRAIHIDTEPDGAA
jgi:hypothetical protein